MGAFAFVAIAMGAVDANGAIRDWNGSAGDWDYGNAANWTGAIPANNDFADTARFGGAATPGTVNIVTPYAGADLKPKHEGLAFTTAGWTLNIDYDDLGVVSSAGAGVNKINFSFECQQNATWTIGTGNTLFMDAGLYLRDKHINLVGGGTLKFDTPLTGFGTSSVYGVHVKDGLLRIEANAIYGASTGGKIYISDDGVLQYQASVAAATALIGTRIIDENNEGLVVTDLGGGYVQVAVPEPAGAMAAGLIAGGALLRRRRRGVGAK